MEVGEAGAGSLLIENQATAITGGSTLALGFDVGTQAGASGVVTVSGTGSLLDNTGEFIVGDGGLGSLSIESGGTVITTPGTVAGLAAVIAAQSGASGASVGLTGAGSDWQVGGTLVVGDAGAGSLNITAGGTVGSTAAVIAAQSGAGGSEVNVAGAGSNLRRPAP